MRFVKRSVYWQSETEEEKEVWADPHLDIYTILFEAPFIYDFASLYVCIEDLVWSGGGHHVHSSLAIHQQSFVRCEAAPLWWSDLEAHSCVLQSHEFSVR